jgi:prepilin peptidase CpaA
VSVIDQITVQQAEWALAATIGLAAIVEDVARGTISNWLSLAALAGGLACQVAVHGWMGFAWGIAGAASGFGVFLLFYLLGGMGGGDVKLMAGFGSLLGAGRLLQAAFWTALVGGVLAAAVLAFSVTKTWWLRKARGESRRVAVSIPYAPAIAAGVWMALLATA